MPQNPLEGLFKYRLLVLTPDFRTQQFWDAKNLKAKRKKENGEGQLVRGLDVSVTERAEGKSMTMTANICEWFHGAILICIDSF